MANSVKMRDVAASAGVSIATVSYVMNGKAEGLGITPVTRQRVLEAIRRTGYRPNQSARDIALGQQSTDSLPTAPALDLATILAAAGYSLVPVTSVNDLPPLTDGIVGVVYEREVRKQKSASFAKAPEAKEVSLSQPVVPESAQTPVVEPVVPKIIPEPEPVVTEPVVAATVVPDLPNSSCPSCPSMLDSSSDTGERDSDMDVQDRVPVSDPTSELPQPVIPAPEPTSSTLSPESETPPNSSCPSCPSMLDSSSDTEETDSNIDRQDVQDRVPVSDPTSESPQPIIPAPEPTSSTLSSEPIAASAPEPEPLCSPGAQSPGSAEQAPVLRNDSVPAPTEVAPASAPQPLEPSPVQEPEPAAQVVEPVPEPVAAATPEPEDSCSPGVQSPGETRRQSGVATEEATQMPTPEPDTAAPVVETPPAPPPVESPILEPVAPAPVVAAPAPVTAVPVVQPIPDPEPDVTPLPITVAAPVTAEPEPVPTVPSPEPIPPEVVSGQEPAVANQ